MIADSARLIERLVQAYAAAGGLVALAFLAFGLTRVAPGARGAYAFRPLLLPGLVLLWPVVLWRWWRLTHPREAAVRLGRRYRGTHRLVWTALAVVLPLALLGALGLRQNGRLEAAAVRLEAPMP